MLFYKFMRRDIADDVLVLLNIGPTSVAHLYKLRFRRSRGRRSRKLRMRRNEDKAKATINFSVQI